MRERIQIVHAHGINILTAEILPVACYLGLKTMFTDHSMYGFDGEDSLHINKTFKAVFDECSAWITVSHCNKENLCLRVRIPPEKIFVIPNAVDTYRFTPNPSLRSPINTVNIVCI